MKGVKQGQYPKSKVQCWVCKDTIERFVTKNKRYICDDCDYARQLNASNERYRLQKAEVFCKWYYGKERSALIKEVKREIYGEHCRYRAKEITDTPTLVSNETNVASNGMEVYAESKSTVRV